MTAEPSAEEMNRILDELLNDLTKKRAERYSVALSKAQDDVGLVTAVKEVNEGKNEKRKRSSGS